MMLDSMKKWKMKIDSFRERRLENAYSEKRRAYKKYRDKYGFGVGLLADPGREMSIYFLYMTFLESPKGNYFEKIRKLTKISGKPSEVSRNDLPPWTVPGTA